MTLLARLLAPHPDWVQHRPGRWRRYALVRLGACTEVCRRYR